MTAKHIRFLEFIRRLGLATAVASRAAAKNLIDDILNAVEDELSDVPFDPDNWRTDGRMYPAQEDSASDVPGYLRVTAYRHRGHETFISDNGAIEIRNIKTAEIVVSKPDVSGNGVWS